jgi:hypothetical protein
MNTWYHAKSSAKKWGGEPEQYLPVHDFIDSSKESFGDMRHRAMLHSTWGIYLAAKVFGSTLSIAKTNNTIDVPTRLVAEQHVLEDLGRLPTLQDWLECMELKPWMGGKQHRTLSFQDFVKEHTHDH